jgi:uncharacterized protein YndB with AHSA1/START domain
MTETAPTVTIERIIPAAPQAVFQAWLDAKALARFMCPAPESSVARAETDPRVGGRFLIVMVVGGKELPHHGVYRAIEPHERLVFSWQSAQAGPDSEVTLTFQPAPGQATRLLLEHRGLDTPEARQAHHGGWSHIVETLVATL